MTTHISVPPVQPATSDPGPPVRAGATQDRSIRQASLIAGVGLLLMSALAVGHFVGIQGLVTQGDAAATATDIMASEGMFRFGIASWMLIVVLDVVVAWALFRVFSPVSTGISRLAAWFRLVYAGVLLVAVSELVAALRLLGGDGYLDAFSTDQLQAQALLRIENFTGIWDAGLLLFGVHLIAIAYLAYRSGYVPKWLGVLLAIAGVGYIFDASAVVLLSEGLSFRVGAFTFIGEFLLAVWLVVWGRRLSLAGSTTQEQPVGITL